MDIELQKLKEEEAVLKKKENKGYDNYGKFIDIVELAIYMQNNSMTLKEIQDFLSSKRMEGGKLVSRKTAERIRDAIGRIFEYDEDLNFKEGAEKKYRLKGFNFSAKLPLSIDDEQNFRTAVEFLKQDGYLQEANCLHKASSQISSLLRSSRTLAETNNLEELIEKTIVGENFHNINSIVNKSILETIRLAIEGINRIQIKILNKVIVLNPYAIFYTKEGVYLIASSKGVESDITYYLINDIQEITLLDEMFEYNFKLSDLKEDASVNFSLGQTDVYDVELLFDESVSKVARQWEFSKKQSVSEVLDRALSVKFNTAKILELSWELARFGNKVKVISPKNFNEIAKKAQQKFEDNGCKASICLPGMVE